MHTKRNRKHHYSRRRHCRSRRAGGLGNLLLSIFSTSSNGLPGTGKKLTSAINKVKDVEDIKFVITDSFIGEMNTITGKYIQGRYYYENGLGVLATEFNDRNRPCGTVMWIDLKGNPIMGADNNPITEYITCDKSHVAEHPFYQ